jgi:hypothetical protein
MTRRIYAMCGLRLRSEMELHLPIHLGDAWDVDITDGPNIDDSSEPPPGEVIAAFETDGLRWYTATSTESGFRFRFRECGEFVISADLAEVEIRRDPAGHVDMLPILMAGTVSAFLLTLRGLTVLHASAVAVDGAALAFVGQSGRGKSTVAALMCAAGAELITDDVLTIDAGQPVRCTGGASELRLRRAAAAIADQHAGAATRLTADDRVALRLRTAPREPLPLGAIVVPGPSRSATELEVRRLPATTALLWILGFPRIFGWCLREVLTRDFATVGKLVDQVPVYEVIIPWGPPFDPDIARVLATLVEPDR